MGEGVVTIMQLWTSESAAWVKMTFFTICCCCCQAVCWQREQRGDRGVLTPHSHIGAKKKHFIIH